MINVGTIIGRLTKDLEMRSVTTDKGEFSIGTGTVAVDKAGPKEDGEFQAGFFDFELTGKAAEVFAQYTSKGSLVGLTYELVQNRWVKDGENRERKFLRVKDFQFLDGKKDGDKSEGKAKAPAKSGKSSKDDEYDPFA